MNKLILFIAFFSFQVTSFSQQVTPKPPLTHDGYMKKSKSQKTVAWILVGGGATMITTGFLIGSKQVEEDPFGALISDEVGASVVLILVGIAATLTSIPLFISSGKNKRRAAAVSFKMEKTPIINQWTLYKNSYPALSVRLSL